MSLKRIVALIAAPCLLVVTLAEAGSVKEIYRKVSASVVQIETMDLVKKEGRGKANLTDSGLGSGVLISEDGHVLTAAHVVQASDYVEVSLADGNKVGAEVVSSLAAADIALLKLDEIPEGAQPATLGDSDRVEVGDQIFVIGSPHGLTQTLTVGHISSRRAPDDTLGGFELGEYLQTDAAINKGNSGGPMFNMQGEVVGIVSHILSKSGGYDGLGFAVTANTARQLLIDRPWFWSGVDGHRIDGKLAQLLNVPQPSAFLVVNVARASIGSQLGLRGGDVKLKFAGETLVLGGDIVIEINGIQVGHPDHNRKMREKLQGLEKGDWIVLKVLREGQILELRTRKL